jgi:hypothetical protein
MICCLASIAAVVHTGPCGCPSEMVLTGAQVVVGVGVGAGA